MSRLALLAELRQKQHEASELARLCYESRLMKMAVAYGLETIALTKILTDMEQAIQKSLESLQTADLVNALPHVDESVVLSFERHKHANDLRSWYFTELSANERRELEKYVGGEL